MGRDNTGIGGRGARFGRRRRTGTDRRGHRGEPARVHRRRAHLHRRARAL